MPSLQDQLLKAGMVDAKKAKRIEKEKRKHAKQVKKGEAEPDDAIKRAAEQSKQDKLDKDREANRQQKALAEQKAIAAQVKQLIQTHRIERKTGGNDDAIGYQFVDGKRIKKIYVDVTQQRQLERGIIAIVSLDGQYELVNAAIAAKLAQRKDDTVIVLNDKQSTQQGGVDEDDPYADFKVPDDLMW